MLNASGVFRVHSVCIIDSSLNKVSHYHSLALKSNVVILELTHPSPPKSSLVTWCIFWQRRARAVFWSKFLIRVLSQISQRRSWCDSSGVETFHLRPLRYLLQKRCLHNYLNWVLQLSWVFFQIMESTFRSILVLPSLILVKSVIDLAD